MYDRSIIHQDTHVFWFTPRHVLRVVQQVFARHSRGGRIDLDPCGHPQAHVKARKIICPPEDGLQYDWKGNVFVNPPYGEDLEKWYQKCWTAVRANVIMLVPAATDTDKFQWYAPRAQAMCMWKGRITFGNPQRVVTQNPLGSIFLLYSSDLSMVGIFLDVFRLHGWTMRI